MPHYVGSGSGAAVTGLTGACSKTGCKAGNFIIVHSLQDGTSGNQSFINVSNIENLVGDDSAVTGVATGAVGSPTTALYDIWFGRVIADGTVSGDFSSSGDDMFGWIHEFGNVSLGTTLSDVIEETTAGSFNFASGTSTTIGDESVTTLGPDRLGVQLITVAAQQSLTDFTGETGDWTEPVAEFASAVGTAGTVGLQIAEIPGAATVDGGTITITSNPWAVLAFALKPMVTLPVDADILRFPKPKMRYANR